MIEVVDAISDDVVAGLAAAGYPRLKEQLRGKPGRIYVGHPSQFDEYQPPRIIFNPLKSDFSGRTSSRGAAPKATNSPGPDAEGRAAAAQRAIFTETVVVEASVCSLAPQELVDNDASADYDRIDYEYTRALYLQVIASMQRVIPGCFEITGGRWEPMRNNGRIVRQFTFNIGLALPVLADLPPTTRAPADAFGNPAVAGLPHAPSDVTPDVTDTFIVKGKGPGGTDLTGPGCE